MYLGNKNYESQINNKDSLSGPESPCNIIAFGINNDNI